jgi:hypothetical protein
VIESLKAVFRVAGATAGQMAERVDKFGRSVVYQGPLATAQTYRQRMGEISSLNVQVRGPTAVCCGGCGSWKHDSLEWSSCILATTECFPPTSRITWLLYLCS